MPFFKVRNKKILLITNFKVMFSSFKRTENFIKLKRAEAFLRIAYTNPLVYFTVRDPYERVASFYKDKFQQHPAKYSLGSSFRWETPQKIFFPLLGLNNKTSNEEIREALLGTSFEMFIDMLAQCYHLDEHVNPQHWILNHPQYRFFKNLNVHEKQLSVFKIENLSHMSEFSYLTGFDSNVSMNSTKKLNADCSMNNEMLKKINSIYANDFKYYGYKLRITEPQTMDDSD
ncbi:MAG: sulfotransferase family 2 domain-containing protein [Pseudomonadales bacterium]